MGTIIEGLQWFVPLLFTAIGSVTTWLINRSLYNARSVKEKQDIYKTLYENLHQTVLNIQNDNKKLNISLIQLERAVSKAVLCRYYDNHCPVRTELQGAKGKHTTKPIGQSGNQKTATNYPRSGTDEQGSDDNDAGDATETPCRDRLL